MVMPVTGVPTLTVTEEENAVPWMVAAINACPRVTPVTKPSAFTVANAGAVVLQTITVAGFAPAGIKVAVSCCVRPIPKAMGPDGVMVTPVAAMVTSTTVVTGAAKPAKVRVIVDEPCATAVATAVGLVA
jgi:hypothetical protein